MTGLSESYPLRTERACVKEGGCTCTDPDATFWICRHAAVKAHVAPGEAFIVPRLERGPMESLEAWTRRVAAGSVKITGLAP